MFVKKETNSININRMMSMADIQNRVSPIKVMNQIDDQIGQKSPDRKELEQIYEFSEDSETNEENSNKLRGLIFVSFQAANIRDTLVQVIQIPEFDPFKANSTELAFYWDQIILDCKMKLK